jgi:hypothetical protein
VTIYGLIDPRGPDLFYIGCTSQTVPKRLAHHVKVAYGDSRQQNGRKVKARIRAILDAGLRPQYVTIERTADAASERTWIEYCEACGIELTNTCLPGGREYVPHPLTRMQRQLAADRGTATRKRGQPRGMTEDLEQVVQRIRARRAAS